MCVWIRTQSVVVISGLERSSAYLMTLGEGGGGVREHTQCRDKLKSSTWNGWVDAHEL